MGETEAPKGGDYTAQCAKALWSQGPRCPAPRWGSPPTQGSKPIEQMGKLSPKGAVTAPSCSETEHGCNPHKCFISYGPIYFPETGPLKNLGVSVGSFRFPGEL